MRIPRWLAWLLIAMGVFTAGLLRQFHDLTPRAPFLTPAVGSLLAACVIFLALVAARERQVGAAPGPGVRLGSVTPILLMLLFEKWFSSSLYQPLFAWLAPRAWSAAESDAWFRALCGSGLLVVVLIAARFSRPAAAWLAARWAPVRVAPGVGAALLAVTGAYAALAGLALLLGARVALVSPRVPGPVVVVILGQAALALAEEAWFRGLLLGEITRLMPRLGVGMGAARRWIPLGATSLLFAMEHLGGSMTGGESARQFVFTGALGLLFGMLVIVTANLWLAAVLHAWINWLLLGVTPRVAYGASDAGVAPGVYIFLALIGAFIAAYVVSRRGDPGPPAGGRS